LLVEQSAAGRSPVVNRQRGHTRSAFSYEVQALSALGRIDDIRALLREADDRASTL
jgi:hypothetical protein